MANRHKRDQWLQELEERQRNVVFPDTLQNETQGWRNLSKRPLTTSAKIGLAFLGIAGWGLSLRILFAAAKEGVLWPLVLGMLLLWGPNLRRNRLGNSPQPPSDSECASCSERVKLVRSTLLLPVLKTHAWPF
jgi:hypothetical protein